MLRLFTLLVFLIAPLLANAQNQKVETIILDGERSCGDTCAIEVSRGKRADEIYMCSLQNLRKLQICQSIFGNSQQMPAVSGKSATLQLLKEKGSDVHFWIVGGQINQPVAKSESARNENQGQFSWDRWLESTGNKPMTSPSVSQVRVTGTAPFAVDTIRIACRNVMSSTNWSKTVNMGMRADGVLSSVEFLPPIDSSQVGGPIRRMLPNGRVTPAKLDILYPRDVVITGARVYLFKDAFGEISCLGPA